VSLPTPDHFDPTPYDVEQEDDEDRAGTPVVDDECEHPDLTIPPEVIQGFSDWTDPTAPPPWETEGT
jgi:hypothetical protein